MYTCLCVCLQVNVLIYPDCDISLFFHQKIILVTSGIIHRDLVKVDSLVCSPAQSCMQAKPFNAKTLNTVSCHELRT